MITVKEVIRKGCEEMLIHSSQLLFCDFFDANLLFARASSRAGVRAGMGQRFWALMKRRAERSPATMMCVPLGDKISTVRSHRRKGIAFAGCQMTGRGNAAFRRSFLQEMTGNVYETTKINM